jgi:isoleucyl-tRNA synthetase
MNNNNNQYPKVSASPNFPEIEKKVLDYWKTNNTFEQSIKNRPLQKLACEDEMLGDLGAENPSVLNIHEGSSTKSTQQFASQVGFPKRVNRPSEKSDEFVFYDGPPFANGLPHYGHLLTGFVKDVFARYHTTKGKRVERRFGWDCHGLPAEMGSEKELKISGRAAIVDFGIDKFNEHCRSSVMKYSSEWEQYVTRQARWVDFDNSYKTMDKNFMESVLWAFKELYKKGLIYESMRVMPYSWACETPLSNFETRLDNSYRERADKAVTVNFILKDVPANLKAIDCEQFKILAWTTTPWTLPSNLALAVGAEIEYALIKKNKICYIVAKSSIPHVAKELDIEETDIIKTIKGADLQGLSYEPLFNYFKDHKAAFKILAGDFVVEGDGTGIVHIAPGFGEDDQLLCSQHGIELVCPVDNSGKFTKEVPDFEGMQVFEANDKIIIKLKEQGNWIKTEQFLHNYPHCWRTDTPLIYKAVPSWYVRVTDFKDRMVELNKQINWIPGHVKDGLFGKWLENARDWSISRNRFWGTPIPIWKSDDPKYPRIDVYGSIEELEKDFGVKITDLHRPFIDQLTRPNPDDPTGKSMMRRVEDVFDCWFESGSMPYGQAHYPFENKEWFESHFPADFIVEYSAQTRGWFYTLMVLSTALFDRPPFLNCICHGVILDSTGQKLSKRLNNYADPLELFEQYGADALRVTMLSSTVVKGQELLIDKDGKMVFDTLRLFIKPIWNSYHFFTLYANADKITASLDFSSTNVLDCYILSKLKIIVSGIEAALDNFDTMAAFNSIAAFFEVLNNWYIRRSRNRFWKSQQDQDKREAYNTLYSCLEVMCRAMSSLMPLIAEEIYLGLTGGERSVHLTDFPKLDSIKTDHDLVQTMDQILDICSSALFIRNSQNVRIRQPLSNLTIITSEKYTSSTSKIARKTSGSPAQPILIGEHKRIPKFDVANLEVQEVYKLSEFEELIKDEVNVKSIAYSNNLDEYASLKLSLNFPVIGKRLPSKVKDIISASKQGLWEAQGDSLLIAGESLSAEEFSIILDPKDPNQSKALSSNKGIVILDLNITKELYEEGIARDLVRAIQQARKDAGFDISDKVVLEVRANNAEIESIIKNHANFINEQTLSKFASIDNARYSQESEVNEQKVVISLQISSEV